MASSASSVTNSSSVVGLLSRVSSFFQSEPASNKAPDQSYEVTYTEEELDALQVGQEEVTRNLRGSFLA